MKHILPFIMGCFPFLLPAQYIPTLKPCNEWGIRVNTGRGGFYDYKYWVENEYSIHDTLYYKLVRQDGLLLGFAREDTQAQQVFYRESIDVQEWLMLDYSLRAGDTLFHFSNSNQGTYTTLARVDTAFSWGRMRRIFRPDTNSSYLQHTEGIGYRYGIYPDGNLPQLVGFQEDSPDCNTATNVAEVSSQFLPKAYPSPFSQELILENPTAQPLQATLWDARGQKHWQGKVGGTPYAISTFHLPPGLYFVRFENGTSLKLMKSH